MLDLLGKDIRYSILNMSKDVRKPCLKKHMCMHVHTHIYLHISFEILHKICVCIHTHYTSYLQSRYFTFSFLV